MMARMSSSRMTRCSAPSILTGAGILVERGPCRPPSQPWERACRRRACRGPRRPLHPGGLFPWRCRGCTGRWRYVPRIRALHKNTVIQSFKLMTTYPPKGIFVATSPSSSDACGESCSSRNGGRVPDIAEEAARSNRENARRGKPCKRAVVFRPLVALNNPLRALGRGTLMQTHIFPLLITASK